MIGPIGIAHHLVDFASAIDHIMSGNLSTVRVLELSDRAWKGCFRAMKDDHLNLCAVAGGMIGALNERFDRRLRMRIGASVAAINRKRLCDYCGGIGRYCYANIIIGIQAQSRSEPG